MATIRKRGPYQWAVQIRRKGYPPQNKTFTTKAEADAWAATLWVKIVVASIESEPRGR